MREAGHFEMRQATAFLSTNHTSNWQFLAMLSIKGTTIPRSDFPSHVASRRGTARGPSAISPFIFTGSNYKNCIFQHAMLLMHIAREGGDNEPNRKFFFLKSTTVKVFSFSLLGLRDS